VTIKYFIVKNENKDGEICEKFLGLISVDDCSHKRLAGVTLRKIKFVERL
jgi:hypothetical protein